MLSHMMLGPLMLLAVLPNVYNACPLTLDPPKLELELGQTLEVNCTSKTDGYRNIIWSYDNKTQTEDEASFSVLSIPQVHWDTLPRCTIMINDDVPCSVDLQITVYKSPATIKVLSTGPAIEGTQLELECEINDVALIQNLTVTWYMNNQIMNTTNYNLTSSTKSMSSSLMRKVKKEDNEAIFTCEVMLHVGPYGPPVLSNETLMLSLQYAPEFHNETEYNHLNNSGNVSLHCEAVGYPPPHYTWTKDGEIVADDTNYLNVSQLNETTTYNCTASNYLGNVTKKFIVTVTETVATAVTDRPKTPEAPKSPGCPLTITPDKITVLYGGSASSNCSTTVTDAEMGWEASTRGIGLEPVTTLTWRVENVTDWAIKAECFITRDEPLCSKHLNITVYKPPDKVQVSPDGRSAMEEDKPHSLKCDIINVAPVGKLQVKWYQDNKLIHTQNQTFTESLEPQNVSLTMTLTPGKKDNRANFTCEAELLLEQNPKVMSKPYTADVQYKPRIQACPGTYGGKEDEFMLNKVPCKADGNPEPAVYWYLQNTLVNSSKPLTRKDLGKYMAKFENIIGNSNTTVDITVEYGPSILCKDFYNITENGNLGSECEPEGVPKPTIVWLKNGVEMAVPNLWTRYDSGKYLIRASNKHGNATHTLSINVLSGPKFSVGSSIQKFTPGENVILECTADGNPLPVLRWNYTPAANVKLHELNTGGRHIYINVTGATSSNEGVYSCGATNEFGTVTRNVTLIMKGEENSGMKIGVPVICILCVLIVVVIVVSVYSKRKCRHYDVVGLSESNIPLT